MTDLAADFELFGETTVFLDYFKDLPDPRQPGKVVYFRNEVLLLSLLGVLAGAESFTGIALFGEKKLAFLRRFLPFKDGTPRAMTGSAKFSQHLMRKLSSAASSHGSQP